MRHRFDPLTDFCMGCGLSAMQHLEDSRPEDCPNNDGKTYLMARLHMEVLVDPILRELGFDRPAQTRH